MAKAYQEGRIAADPSVGWFHGELWFFDNYIIPLAKKLFDCGVFGVSSDEYLQYAKENRTEWEAKGRDLVAGWVEKYLLDESSGRDGGSTDTDDVSSSSPFVAEK